MRTTILVFSFSLLIGSLAGCGSYNMPTPPRESRLGTPPPQSSAPESIRGPRFTIATNLGEIVVALDSVAAPRTCANFRLYASQGHYDGTIFHRVIRDFMIQGGGLDFTLTERPTRAPIENEAANCLRNERGTLAMARTSDVHSATSQFFINVVDNNSLDHRGMDPRDFGYCVFGRVVEGMSTVDSIQTVRTGARGLFRDVPLEPVRIDSVRVVRP